MAPPQRARWPGVLLLALSLALGADLLERYRDARREVVRLDAQAGLMATERRPAVAIPKQRLDEQVKAAEVVVRQLTIPWAGLVGAIEQAATPDVAILQLQPDSGERVLRLTAAARHQQAMFEYVRRLGAARELADVHLASHQSQPDDPQLPIQFTVLAVLR